MSEQLPPDSNSEFQFQSNPTPAGSGWSNPRPTVKWWQRPGFPLVSYAIAGITVLFFLAQQILKRIYGIDLLFVLLGKVNALILTGEVWRLFTPALLHSNLLHLVFNLYALSILGRQIEPFYGKGRFLLLYLLGAFGGNVLSFVLSDYNSLGASTAIFGLLAAEAVFIWQNREIFGKQSQGMLMNLGFVVALNFFIGMSPISNTDNWGHLGGLLAGFFFAFMAGPHLQLRRHEAGFRLEDIREKHQVWLAAIMVLIGFGTIAAIPFFNK